MAGDPGVLHRRRHFCAKMGEGKRTAEDRGRGTGTLAEEGTTTTETKGERGEICRQSSALPPGSSRAAREDSCSREWVIVVE